jgi:hypothetical protein
MGAVVLMPVAVDALQVVAALCALAAAGIIALLSRRVVRS